MLRALTAATALALTPGAATAQDLASYLAGTLDSVWVVAIGEHHGHVELHTLLVATLEDPDVQARLDDIVVEFGNARYQAVVDRFVDGDSVPMDSVRLAWRNTVVSPNTVWDAPVYEAFYRALRRINAERVDGRSYRLVLADTPVDWDQVSQRDDLTPFYDRSAHMAETVRTHVLREGRRALLIAGGAHLTRVNIVRTGRHGVPSAEISVISRLELRHPGATRTVRSLGRIPDVNLGIPHPDAPTVVARLEGALSSISANSLSTMRNMDGTPFTGYGDATLADLVDAVILWPPEMVTIEPAAPDVFDDDYWSELERRSIIVRGASMDPALRRGRW